MAARARSRHDDDIEPAPRSDAYVGLLAISLVALLLGCLFLFLDYNQYPVKSAPKISESLPPRPQPQPKGP
jgi:hypothetical protein